MELSVAKDQNAERLQKLIDELKSEGLIDVKFLCSPNEDVSLSEFYKDALDMLEKHKAGHSKKISA